MQKKIKQFYYDKTVGNLVRVVMSTCFVEEIIEAVAFLSKNVAKVKD